MNFGKGLGAFFLALAVQIPVISVTNSLLEKPYMDETFHFNQVLEIQQNPTHPQWDPKITTPSGLYYVSLILCAWHVDIIWLRFTSTVFNAGIFSLLTLILPSQRRAIEIFTFPPLFFFGQMYYTDSGGLFFILLGWYLLCKEKKVILALVACAISIWFRQTNLVWTLFVGGWEFLDRFERVSSWTDFQFWTNAVKDFSGFVFLPLAYLLHVFRISRSQQLVFGDEENHQLSLHFAQLCYLSLPLLSFQNPRLLLKRPPKLTVFLLALLISVIFVGKFSITHPFLLADNRHVSFYIWSKFFNKHWVNKYSLAPFSALSFSAIVENWKSSWLKFAAFFMACLLSLVPLPLFEFRYFLVAYVLYGCVEFSPDRSGNALLIPVHIVVIGIVQYFFWFRPFIWGDGTVARFMW